MKRVVILPAVLLPAVLLSACGSPGSPTAPAGAPASATAPASTSATAVPPSASATAAPSSAGEGTRGAYLEYADYQRDPGAQARNTVVLFFHAPWCPSCRQTESSLTRDGVPAGLTVVKVDYDSMGELKKKYGVTVQHTFVKIDGGGAATAKWTGSASGREIAEKAKG